LVVVVAVAVRK